MEEKQIAKQTDIQKLTVMLENRKDLMLKLLPSHLKPERMVKVALMAFSRSEHLRKCSLQSILSCVIQGAEIGLEPGSVLGHAYLVPFKGQCQLIIGYKGMIELARRSGQIESIAAYVIHKNDTFELDYGADVLIHKPLLTGDPGEFVAVWARAKLVGGGSQLVVMMKHEIDKIRARSRSGDKGPWATDYEEMAKKTAVRRLFKYLPVSVEMAKALTLDAYRDGEAKASDVSNAFEEADFVEVESEEVEQKEEFVAPDVQGSQNVPEDAEIVEEPKSTERADLDFITQRINEAKDEKELKLVMPLMKEKLHGAAHASARARFTERLGELQKGGK